MIDDDIGDDVGVSLE